MPSDLREICTDLTRLGEKKPTPDARRLIAEALTSKWDGVQVTAVKVLGRWGEHKSVPILLDWIDAATGAPNAFAISAVGFRALAQCTKRTDTGWLMERYFARPNRGAMYPVMQPLDPADQDARALVMRHFKSTDTNERIAALLAIAWVPYPDRDALMDTALKDRDAGMRAIARAHNFTRLGN